MDGINTRKEKKIYLPGLIFINIMLGGFGIFGFYINWKADQPVIAILSAIFVATHIGLYWLNLRQFHHKGWWVFYYGAQTVLILVVTNLPYSGENRSFGISFLGSATIMITGEILSIWGNTRRSLFLGLFYLSILLGIFFIKVEPDLILPYLTQVLIVDAFVVILMFVLNLQIKERKKAEELAETLESTNVKLVTYATRNELLTLQAERERMARELHDTLAQGVAGLILQLEAIKEHQQQNRYSQAMSVLEQAIARARNTLSESRSAIEDLRNEDRDFQKTLEDLVEQFGAGGKTSCELKLQLEAENPIPQHIQHHVRRVLHEGLTNIQKHALAETACLSVIQSGSALRLSIQDNGIGFDPQKIPTRGHFGLQGFKERAQLTNSIYKLISAPDEGTTIEFIFPLVETGGRA